MSRKWQRIAAAALVAASLCGGAARAHPAVSQFWKYDPKEFLANPVYSRDWPPARNLEK